MFVVCVSIQVRPGRRDGFIEATLDNARHTREEPANLRFDVLQQEEDPDRFTLYEVYRTQAGFEEHQRTAHYLRWKETVKDWMAVPRVGVRHKSLFPVADAGW